MESPTMTPFRREAGPVRLQAAGFVSAARGPSR